MSSEKEQFEDNKVLLWGLKQAKDKYLKIYDTGNKNPRSKAKTKKTIKETKEEMKKHIKREYDPEEEYYVEDLDFLNKEYDRISAIMEKKGFYDKPEEEQKEIEDLQEKLYDLICDLEEQKEWEAKVTGKGLLNDKSFNSPNGYDNEEKVELPDTDDEYEDDEPIRDIKLSKSDNLTPARGGALEDKPNKKPVKTEKKVVEKKVEEKKARMVKGSEEAKEWARKMAEARKAKNAPAQEVKKKEVEEKKKAKEERVKKNKKPWYYIGDIPTGYRESTEEEAIKAGKVSEYGKHQVDETRYNFWKNYKVLLTDTYDDRELSWVLNGTKRKIKKVLEDVEIYSNKVQNPRHEERWDEFKELLKEAQKENKDLQKAWNWLYKIYCERKGIKYEKQTFKYKPKELEPGKKIDIKALMESGKQYTKEKHEAYEEHKREIEKVKEHVFEKDGDYISLDSKYFDKDIILKPSYAIKLFKENIILPFEYYRPEELEKIIYKKADITGGKLVRRIPDKSENSIVQSVLFDKKRYTIREAKEWLKENNFYSDNIDITDKELRFRQYNPDDLQTGRHYISKPIKNKGILLIISVKGNMNSHETYTKVDKHHKLSGSGFFDKITDKLVDIGYTMGAPGHKTATAMNRNKYISDSFIMSGKMTKDYILPAVVDVGLPAYYATAGAVGGVMGGPIGSAKALALADKLWREYGNPNRPEQKSMILKKITAIALKEGKKHAYKALEEPKSEPVKGGQIHIDINSHNAERDNKTVGDGLKRKRGRPKKVKPIVVEDISKKPLSKRLMKANNKSLNQLMEAMEEKEMKETRKLIKEGALAQKKTADLLGLGIKKPKFIKGSPEAKEHMARIRAMRQIKK